jgi:hypothetical protein
MLAGTFTVIIGSVRRISKRMAKNNSSGNIIKGGEVRPVATAVVIQPFTINKPK